MTGDSLSAAAVTEDLETRFIGQRVVYYPSLPSTNEAAKEEAVGRQAVEGTVFLTGEQTAGKGRLKRTWLTPEGNIALSVVLYPRLADLPSLIMMASLAVVHGIEAATGLKAQIKWPNDVLIDEKKVCGILIESDVRGGVVNYVVIGIGINVNLSPTDYSGDLPVATSLAGELGRDVSRLSVIRCLLVEMEKLYLSLSAGGSVYEEWRDSLVTLGRRVRAKTGGEIYEGIAESVDRDGSLMLLRDDGSLTRIVAGDVTLRA